MKSVEIRTVQRSKETELFREKVYKASDKVKQTVSVYDVMKAFDDYLEDISGEWLPRPDGRFIYAQCSECGEIHDTASNYCPSCGCLMDRNGFNAYIKAESEE